MWRRFRVNARRVLSLEEDKEQEQAIVMAIKKGAVFRGTNLWVLVFSVFIASIGLNTNSISVIIGAMLISPLMGPIYGIGLSLATYDFEFFKKALRNLAIFVVFSLTSSTLYFWLSPLKEVQSEMIAYTHPTLWDVLVAFIGGLAGIVGASRTRQGTILTGVAIATGMMLPLCTAGFGIANRNWPFVAGAIYLFAINGVCISFSTYIIVRFLRFRPHTYVDEAVQLRVRRNMTVMMIVTLLPSIYLAYQLVSDTLYRRNLKRFVDERIKTGNHYVIQQTVVPGEKGRKVEILVVGERIKQQEMDSLRQLLPHYHLDNTELELRYGFDDNITMEASRHVLTETEKLILAQRVEMDSLRKSVGTPLPPADSLARELRVLIPEVKTLSVGPHRTADGDRATDSLVCVVGMDKPDGALIPRIRKWLSVRLGKPESDIRVLMVR